MPHVVSGVVENVDMRKADHSDDEKSKRHGQNGLDKPAGDAAGNRHMGGVGPYHASSPVLAARQVTSFRAMSRLVK
jgi:hypothetical protein